MVTEVPSDQLDELDDLAPEVRQLLAELEENHQMWEEELASEESDYFSVAHGGVEALGDRDGGLKAFYVSEELWARSTLELEQTMNVVFHSLAATASEADATDESGDDEGQFEDVM